MDVSEGNYPNAESSDNYSEYSTAPKIDSLIAIKQKQLKSWEEMIVQKKEEYETLENLC